MMIEKYLKTDAFVQVMRQSGSFYGTVVEVSEHWLVVRDADSHEIFILSIDPSIITAIITGNEAKSNYKEASERPSTESLMAMAERSLSGLQSQ